MKSIFLSYSSADRPFTLRLANCLRESSVRVWMDEAELRIGDSLIETLSSAISEIDYVGPVISARSVESRWVRVELRLAMNKEVELGRAVVLPLLIENVELPHYLADKKYADFREIDIRLAPNTAQRERTNGR